MGAANGSTPTDPRDPASAAYAAAAGRVDKAITTALRHQLMLGYDPGAVVAGACTAIVRICIGCMLEPLTVRKINETVFPSINAAAESLLNSETPKP